MVLNNIQYPVFRRKQITSQGPLSFDVILRSSNTGVATFSSLAELNQNSATDFSDPELLTAIQQVGTDINAFSSTVQTFITGVTTTRDYADNESALDAFKTALQTTDTYKILKTYTDYHVTTYTNNATDYLSYSKQDWELGKLNNSLLHSTLRRNYESLQNLLQQLATLIVDTSVDPLYQSIHSLSTQINTTLSGVQATSHSISNLIDKLDNGIETVVADVTDVKTKYAQVSSHLAEASSRLGKIFTGGAHSLDLTA